VLEPCVDLVRAGGRVAYPNGIEPEPNPIGPAGFAWLLTMPSPARVISHAWNEL
jgi:hypothetical protein